MIKFALGTLAGLGLAVILAAIPAAAQTGPEAVALADGRKLLMSCVGEGGPTIVLDAGMGLPLPSWSKVMPELGKTARTCAYNRAGYVGSDAGPMPRDAAHMVDDIKAMLTAVSAPGPYVVVAQSLGGHNARLFAARYPDEVVGVVLIDPITDHEDMVRAAYVAAVGKDEPDVMISRCVATRARGETWSATDPAFTECGTPPKLPAPAAEIAMAQAVKSEWDHMNDGPAQIRAAAKAPAKFPILVLTADGATRGEIYATTHAVSVEQHRAIAATSLAGEQRTIKGSTHMMQWDNPQVVIDAVREVVARYRSRR